MDGVAKMTPELCLESREFSRHSSILVGHRGRRTQQPFPKLFYAVNNCHSRIWLGRLLLAKWYGDMAPLCGWEATGVERHTHSFLVRRRWACRCRLRQRRIKTASDCVDNFSCPWLKLVTQATEERKKNPFCSPHQSLLPSFGFLSGFCFVCFSPTVNQTGVGCWKLPHRFNEHYYF